MSMVDDLWHAEDMAGLLASAVRQLLDGTVGARREAKLALEAWDSYCRPWCGADGAGVDQPGHKDDCCGCPCHYRNDPDDEPPPNRPLTADEGNAMFAAIDDGRDRNRR